MTATTTTIIRDDNGHTVRMLHGKPVKFEGPHAMTAAGDSLTDSFLKHAHLQEQIRERYPKRD